MAKNVKVLKPFTIRDTETGVNTSYQCGQIVNNVVDATASAWISAGFAEEYTLLTPTGKKTISANGDNIDVKEYATVKVNVT